jgi:hypothetical protein
MNKSKQMPNEWREPGAKILKIIDQEDEEWRSKVVETLERRAYRIFAVP